MKSELQNLIQWKGLVGKLFFGVVLMFALAPWARSADIKPNIVVESLAVSDVDFEKPCYVIYPEGEALQAIKASKTDEIIEGALEKKGYLLVDSLDDAKVFIKVGWQQFPAFEAEVELKSRGAYDYSRSPSTRNFAATLPGGRYSEIGQATRLRQTHASGFILGPDGKPIDIGEQEDPVAKYVEGESEVTTMTLYPIVLQVSALVYSADEAQVKELWRTQSLLENVVGEAPETQLVDLAKASAKEFGEALDKPRIIQRRSGRG